MQKYFYDYTSTCVCLLCGCLIVDVICHDLSCHCLACEREDHAPCEIAWLPNLARDHTSRTWYALGVDTTFWQQFGTCCCVWRAGCAPVHIHNTPKIHIRHDDILPVFYNLFPVITDLSVIFHDQNKRFTCRFISTQVPWFFRNIQIFDKSSDVCVILMKTNGPLALIGGKVLLLVGLLCACGFSLAPLLSRVVRPGDSAFATLRDEVQFIADVRTTAVLADLPLRFFSLSLLHVRTSLQPAHSL